MKITYSQGKNNKIHISADGEYQFTVDASFWFSLCIYQDTEMDEESFAALTEKILVRRAFNKGMEFLGRRAHSKKELIEKISKTNEKKYAIIACDSLEERGYLNDADFAEAYYDYLKRVKHFGAQRIRLELGKKGIDKSVFDTLFEADVTDPREEIRNLLHSRFAFKTADEKQRRRTVNALLRMGYSYSDINNEIHIYENEEAVCQQSD